MTKQQLLDILVARFYKVPTPNLTDEKFGIKEYNMYPWVKEGDQIYKQYVSFCVEDEGGAGESAYWSGQEPRPAPIETFTTRALVYIKEKITDGTVKFAYIVSSNNDMKRCLGVAVTPANAKKDFLLTEDASKVMTLTVL